MSDHIPDNRRQQRYSVLGAIMLAGLVGPIDASIVNVVFPTISEGYGIDVATATWVPTVYLLGISILLLFHGCLGDVLGYRKIAPPGLTASTVASALCGLSRSIGALIASRAVQGLAAGMMMVVSFASSLLHSLRRRGARRLA